MSTVAPHRTASELSGELRVLTEASTPDRVLVTLAGDGDERAFELLYARHRGPVLAYAQRMLGDHARAEDVLQEVFVSALRAMDAGERPTHVRAWLHEISRRACIDQWRGVTRRGEVSYDAPEGLSLQDADCLTCGEDTVLRAAEDREAVTTLRHAFGDLSELQHTVLVQRELEGRSPREIAERLGLSRTVVEGQLARGRRALAQAYRELQSGERCRATRALSEAAVERAIGVRDRQRLGSHLRTCTPCRQHARALGVHPRFFDQSLVARAAALFPFPLAVLRRWWPLDTAVSGEAAGGALGGKVLVGAAVLAAGSGGAFVAGTPASNPFAADPPRAAPSATSTVVTSPATIAPAAFAAGRVTVTPATHHRREHTDGVRIAPARSRDRPRRPALSVTPVPETPHSVRQGLAPGSGGSAKAVPPPAPASPAPPSVIPTRVGPAEPSRVGSGGSTAVPAAPDDAGPSTIGDAVVLSGSTTSDGAKDPSATTPGSDHETVGDAPGDGGGDGGALPDDGDDGTGTAGESAADGSTDPTPPTDPSEPPAGAPDDASSRTLLVPAADDPSGTGAEDPAP